MVLASTPALPSPFPHSCIEVSFPVSVEFQSVLWANSPDPADEVAVLNFLKAAAQSPPSIIGTQTSHADVKVYGTYCPPRGDRVQGTNTLQILVHSGTYNRTVWQGLGFADAYSYQLC
jgi:hypothetical protein